MDMIIYWIREITLLMGGALFIHPMEKQKNFGAKITISTCIYLTISGARTLLQPHSMPGFKIIQSGFIFLLLILFLHSCWRVTWSVAIYYSIWGFISWQLLYELWMISQALSKDLFAQKTVLNLVLLLLTFLIGYTILGMTLAKWLPEHGGKNIGPRQLVSAIVIFFTFQIITLISGNEDMNIGYGKHQILYLTQLLIALILYLQSELFKKSVMRQELSVLNLLTEKAQQQYQLSQENILLINQKCHDLKHQIRAIRNSSIEDINQYLEEIEDSIYIYEAIVKTGNEVLDTVLTEKSLYCKERGITVSCVADGSQMDFINTIDLYAILGNAFDNAIEAVEQFTSKEKRQIDVLIYRQQHFLVMNIINPIMGNLIYKEELPITTKKDKHHHGYGIKSMKHLVKKYNGFLNISEEDGCFSLKMLIPIPEST